MRIERDTHGEMTLDDQCYYGLQTARALENFPILLMQGGLSHV